MNGPLVHVQELENIIIPANEPGSSIMPASKPNTMWSIKQWFVLK